MKTAQEHVRIQMPRKHRGISWEELFVFDLQVKYGVGGAMREVLDDNAK